MMSKWRYLPVVVMWAICLVCVACSVRRERADLIAFATVVQRTEPDGEKLLERFKSLQQVDQNDPKHLAELMGQLVQDIDAFLVPVRKLDIRSKQVNKLRAEYLLIWTSLQEGMRMALEVMAMRDPRLAASLNDRLTKQNNIFMAALQQFNTDYSIMMQRYGITNQDLGLPTPAPQQPQPLPFSPAKMP